MSANSTLGLKQVDGSLVLGGYDSTRFTPNNVNFTFASNDAAALTVGVQSIIASDSLQGVQSFTTTGHLSVLDSSVEELWLPEDICDSMANAFGLIFDPESELYVLNDTVHTKLQQMNPNITIALGNTAYNNGKSTNIVLPYAAFDMQVSWPIYQSSFNYFPIRRAANNTQYTIGRTLLQEAYLIVDYERQNFSISQAVWPDPLPPPQIEIITSLDSTSATSTSTPAKQGLSTGAIAGVAVGGAAALILIAVGAFIFFRRRRQRRQLVPTNESGFWNDRKPATGNEVHRPEDLPYLEDSFYSPERKQALRDQENAQELQSNEFTEMDGQGVFRSELPANKPDRARGGIDDRVYEMSSEGTGTWHSGRQSGMTGTLGSQTTSQGLISPHVGWGSSHGSQSGSQPDSRWGPSPYGSQHESSTQSTYGPTHSSHQSTPYELP